MPSTVFSDDRTYVGSSSNSAPSPDHLGKPVDKGKRPEGSPPARVKTSFLDNANSLATFGSKRTPFFQPIEESTGGLLGAIQRLDEELSAANRDRLISHKSPWKIMGRTVEPGCVGLYTNGATPRLILKPGRYPGLPFANWIARSWYKPSPVVQLSSSVISFGGFVAVQVAGNNAAIVASPSNEVFLIKGGGFAALSLNGQYRVLGVVDQVNLKTKIVDKSGSIEHRVLGHMEEVKMQSTKGDSYVVATFLGIPAQNLAILQMGDELQELPAGQHCIINPAVTIRGWFSRAESQLEMVTPDIYTRDQVPVVLKVYVRWTLFDPLKLCREGYETPYAALRDKCLSCLTQVVSHLEYATLIKQRGFDASEPIDSSDSSGAFLDALRNRAMDDIHEIAYQYGIELKDLAVIDRAFKGETARTLDSLTVRALAAQVEAANIERENSNKVKAQEGALQVATVAAKQRKTEADAAAYTTIAAAKAAAEAVEIAARARANAVAIEADADANVRDEQARRMQMARIEVARVGAYGNKTVFVPESSGVGATVLAGHAFAVGAAQAGKA